MDAATLVSVLTWALVTVAGGLIGSLVWFAMRIVAQLDRLEKLLTDETHALDMRVTRLEDWRTTVMHKPGVGGVVT